MFEVATDKELRLFRGDVERGISGVDRVGDLLYIRFKTGNRFADRGKQAGAVDLRVCRAVRSAHTQPSTSAVGISVPSPTVRPDSFVVLPLLRRFLDLFRIAVR